MQTAEAGLEATFPLACRTRVLVPAPALDSDIGGAGGSGGQTPRLSWAGPLTTEQDPDSQVKFLSGQVPWGVCLSCCLRDTAGRGDGNTLVKVTDTWVQGVNAPRSR